MWNLENISLNNMTVLMLVIDFKLLSNCVSGIKLFKSCTTVKVVIFARNFFHASAIFDIFACLQICVFQPSYIDLHKKYTLSRVFNFALAQKWAKGVKINVARKFPLLQYFVRNYFYKSHSCRWFKVSWSKWLLSLPLKLEICTSKHLRWI